MRRAGGKRIASGVTLLEMLVVVGLIAAASLLAIAVLTGGRDGMRLRSNSKEIAAQLRFTRAYAIATGRPQRFLIDPVERTWSAPNNHRGQIPDSLEVRFTGARQAGEAGTVGGILFFPDGASTGGRIQLEAKRGVGWKVDVTWLTGEVRLSRLSGDSS
ncbi:MAG: GspH/FimT family pseudopilin [Xanthomonadaceae bacterium]|jgi:general secretion pathway protein H|nr:GspH/FimT family pseudopilin [Xanthomonadaceae bacterium]